MASFLVCFAPGESNDSRARGRINWSGYDGAGNEWIGPYQDEPSADTVPASTNLGSFVSQVPGGDARGDTASRNTNGRYSPSTALWVDSQPPVFVLTESQGTTTAPSSSSAGPVSPTQSPYQREDDGSEAMTSPEPTVSIALSGTGRVPSSLPSNVIPFFRDHIGFSPFQWIPSRNQRESGITYLPRWNTGRAKASPSSSAAATGDLSQTSESS
jgi:hypothetical protein